MLGYPYDADDVKEWKDILTSKLETY
ncbi:hypothetical protein EMIT07CA2_80099 [Brevibacillus sp. IT-7CA2]